MPFLSKSRVVNSHQSAWGSHHISDCSGTEVSCPGSTICASPRFVPFAEDAELEAAMLPVSGDMSRTTIAKASKRRSIVPLRTPASIQPNLFW